MQESKEFEQEVEKILTSANLTISDLLKEVTEMEADIELIKSLKDSREKIDFVRKVIIKSFLRTVNLRNVAEMAGISSKWVKSDNYNRESQIRSMKCKN